MNVALIQSSPVSGDIATNSAALADAIGSVRADFYVLPELCLTGYDFEDRKEAEAFALDAASPAVEAPGPTRSRPLRFTGESVIVAPGGEYVLRLSRDRSEAAVATAHPALARNEAINPYNDLAAVPA